jgi:hypothetical protein
MAQYQLTNGLHLRMGPSRDSGDLGIFPQGTIVDGVGFNPERTWLQVSIPQAGGSPLSGWMSLRFLKPLKTPALNWQLGINMREFAYYGTGVGFLTSQTLRQEQLAVCENVGIKLVRFFASRHEEAFDLAKTIQQVGQALDLLDQHHMQAVVCLEDSLTGANQYMQGNDTFHTGPHGHLVADFWRQQCYGDAYLKHLRAIVKAFQAHPAVLMWELGNEFGLYPQPPQAGDSDAFATFVQIASAEIKNIAPQHLVALGLVRTHEVFSQMPGATLNDRKKAARKLYSLPGVDAVGVHYYRDQDNQGNWVDSKDFIDIDFAVARDLGKPFYIGEVGARKDSPNRPAFYHDEVKAWKDAGAFSVLPWQLDSAPFDVGIGDDFGISKRHGDYQPILDQLTLLA